MTPAPSVGPLQEQADAARVAADVVDVVRFPLTIGGWVKVVTYSDGATEVTGGAAGDADVIRAPEEH